MRQYRHRDCDTVSYRGRGEPFGGIRATKCRSKEEEEGNSPGAHEVAVIASSSGSARTIVVTTRTAVPLKKGRGGVNSRPYAPAKWDAATAIGKPANYGELGDRRKKETRRLGKPDESAPAIKR